MPTIPTSRVLIVATDGFEEWELFGPRQILQQRGAEVVLASLKLNPIQATVHDDPGKTIRPDLTIGQASADDWEPTVALDPSSSYVYQVTTGRRCAKLAAKVRARYSACFCSLTP